MLKKTTVQIPLFATQDKSVDPKVMSIDRLEVAENVKVTQAGRVSARDAWRQSPNNESFAKAIPCGDRMILETLTGAMLGYTGSATPTIFGGVRLPYALAGKIAVGSGLERKHQAEVCWHPSDGSYLVAWTYCDLEVNSVANMDVLICDSNGNVQQSFPRIATDVLVDATYGPSTFGVCFNVEASLFFVFYRTTSAKGVKRIAVSSSSGSSNIVTLVASSTASKGVVRAFYHSTASSGYKTYIVYDTAPTVFRISRIADTGSSIASYADVASAALIDASLSATPHGTSFVGMLVAYELNAAGTCYLATHVLNLDCSGHTSSTIEFVTGTVLATPYFDLALNATGTRAFWSYSDTGYDYLSSPANRGFVSICYADISATNVATKYNQWLLGASVAGYPFIDPISSLEILPVTLHPADSVSQGCFALVACFSANQTASVQAAFGHGFTLPFYHLASRSMSRADPANGRLAFLTAEGQGYYSSTLVPPYGSSDQPVYNSNVSIYSFNFNKWPTPVQAGDTTFVPGALPRVSYGADLLDLNFFPGNKGWNQFWPADTGTVYSYSYSYVIESVDSFGKRVRSAPATVKQFKALNPIGPSYPVVMHLQTINTGSANANGMKQVKFLLYRTVDNGSILYLDQVYSNDSGAFDLSVSDAVTDAVLLSATSASLGHPALIDVDEITAGPCPPCSVAAVFQKRLFVVSDENPRQVWFTRELDEEASSFAPRFSEELVVLCPETITSLQVLDDKLVCFSRDHVFVLTGEGPGGDGTGGTYQVSQVQSESGALAHESTLAGDNEILFMSPAGMLALDRGLNVSFVREWEALPSGTTVVNSVGISETRQEYFLLSDSTLRVRDSRLGLWSTYLSTAGIGIEWIMNFQGVLYFRSTGNRLMRQTPGQWCDYESGVTEYPVILKVKTPQIKLSDVAQGVQRIWRIGVQSVEDATATGRVMQIKLYPDNASVASTTYNLALPGPYVRIGSNPQRCSSMAIEISNAGSAATAHPFELLGLTLECGVNRAIVAKTTQNG